MCSILCGLVVAQNYKKGKELIEGKEFADNAGKLKSHAEESPPPSSSSRFAVFVLTSVLPLLPFRLLSRRFRDWAEAQDPQPGKDEN